MKKILILILFLIFGWAGSTWFISNQTESQLKTYIQNTQNAYTEMGIKSNYTIKNYKKSFLKSTATTVISLNTGDAEIDKLFSNIQFNNTITHGPILLLKGIPSFGLAHIHSELDSSTLKPETQVFLKKLFADKNPLSANITFGISDMADYDLSIPAINVAEGESQFTLEKGIYLTGVVNKTTLTGTVNGTLGKVHIIDDGLTLNTTPSTISVDMQEMIAGQMIGTSHFAIANIDITGNDVPPVSFGVDFASNTNKAGNEALDSEITLLISKIKAPLDISDIKLNSTFKAFQIKGIEQLAAIQNDVQQLQASTINGTMNAAEQEALLNKLQNLPNIMLVAVQNTLKENKTAINVTTKITSQQGNAHLAIDTRYIGNGADLNLEELTTGGLLALQKVINVNIDFNAPKAMIASTPAAIFLPSLIENGVITEKADSYHLKVSLKKDEIDLNGKSINTEEFIRLMEAIGLAGGSEELPPGIDVPENADLPIDSLPVELLQELSQQSDKELEAQGVPAELLDEIKKIRKEKTK